MMPAEFLTIPDRIILALEKMSPATAWDIRKAMLDRDPGEPAPSLASIRATLARSVDRFERVGRGLYALKEAGHDE